MNRPTYDHFEFEIGQFVCAAHVAVEKPRDSSAFLRDAYQVIGRIYEEYPGGSRIMYLCRPIGSLVHDKRPLQLNEVEIIELPKEPLESR